VALPMAACATAHIKKLLEARTVVSDVHPSVTLLFQLPQVSAPRANDAPQHGGGDLHNPKGRCMRGTLLQHRGVSREHDSR
jgi:hypothetical protein